MAAVDLIIMRHLWSRSWKLRLSCHPAKR